MRKPVETTMRAAVLDGKVRFTRSYPAPATVAGECLIRVLTAGVCSTDLELAKGYMSFSGVIGHEFVGRVEDAPEAGLVGSRVVCEINCVCGQCDLCQSGLRNHCRNRTVIGISRRDGCFADLIAVPQRNCFRVPDSIDDEQAVFVEPLAAAIQVIKQVPVDAETKATVLGDGRLGLLVAQVLQSAGVANLTLVGRHPHKLALLSQRGVLTVESDAAKPDHSQDLVVDCTGKPAGLAAAMEFVRPRGVIVLKSTYADPGAVNLAPLVINEVQVIGSRCGPFPDAIDLLARKQVDVTGLISKRFKLDRVADALDAAARPDNVKVLLTVAG
jgi:threonine dehydrogenase-like Zn-dependent dehydrogenase